MHGIPLIRQSAEAVLALHPDFVVTYQYVNRSSTPCSPPPASQSTMCPSPIPFADIRKITHDLGDALGQRPRADALIAEMDRKLASARAHAPSPAVSTLIYEPNGYVTGDGVTNEVLTAGGMRNAGPDMHQARNGTVPVEMIAYAPPELLVLNDAREATPAHADLLLRHPALAALSSRTVVAHLSLTPLLCPGPWSADSVAPLEALALRARAARPRN